MKLELLDFKLFTNCLLCYLKFKEGNSLAKGKETKKEAKKKPKKK